MEFFRSFTSFVTILNESIKLLPRNGKLMAFIAMSSLLLSSTFFLLFNYSMQSIVTDNTNKIMKVFMPDLSSFNVTDPNSFTPNTAGFDYDKITTLVREYFALLFAIQIPFLFALFVISFFSSISTILVSSMSYSFKKSSVKEVFSVISKVWKGPMVTILYVSVLAMGYTIFALMWSAPLLLYPSITTYWLAISLVIFAVVLYLYLFVSWGLAVVVSVLEEGCYGFEALARAGKLAEGKKYTGFLVNVCFNAVGLIVFWGCKKIVLLGDNKGFVSTTLLYGIVVVSVSCLGKILMAVVYTVLYLQCKVDHGEQIELHGSVYYSKLSTATQLANEMP